MDTMKASSSSLAKKEDEKSDYVKSPSLSQFSPLPSNVSFWSEIDQLTKRVAKMNEEIPSFALFRVNDPNFHTPPDASFENIFQEMSSQDAAICGLRNENFENVEVADLSYPQVDVHDDVSNMEVDVTNLNSQDDVLKQSDSYILGNPVDDKVEDGSQADFSTNVHGVDGVDV